jgi:addiction module HigA family antidote
MANHRKPVHPGRVIRQEFLEPTGTSQYKLAHATGLTETLISGILLGRRNITAATALRLERALGVSARTWLNLQALYDLEKAESEAGRAIRATTHRLPMKIVYEGDGVFA